MPDQKKQVMLCEMGDKIMEEEPATEDCWSWLFFLVFSCFLQQDSLDLMRQGLESCTTKKIKREKKWRRQNVRVLVLPKNWICIHMPVEWYAIESTHVLCNIVKTNGVGYSCHPGEEHSFKSCLPFQDFSRVSLVSDPYCLCLLYYVERIRRIPAKA